MSTFEIVPNPDFEGRKPTKLDVLCHDRTPFVTVRCGCGYTLHLHESQIFDLHDTTVVTECHSCHVRLTFPPGTFAAAFAEQRRLGWID